MKSKALLLIVIASQLTCHQALFTAPPGSAIVCSENPRFIAAFNGVSVISCIVTEPAGTLVADGTVVQFFTTLGRIPEQGRTNDGVVRVNLEADGRSGTANGTAVSGGEAAAPGTTTTTTVIPERSGPGASSAGALAVVGALQNSATFEVDIGNLNATRVLLVAFPNRLTDSRTSQITANVFDTNGNPAPGVPVIFSVDSATEHMDSQGRPIFTDSNGQARDVMRTRYPRESPARSAEVTATTANGIFGMVTVFIN